AAIGDPDRVGEAGRGEAVVVVEQHAGAQGPELQRVGGDPVADHGHAALPKARLGHVVGEVELVVAAAAGQQVVPAAADDGVVARPAGDSVGARAHGDLVVAV